MRAVVHPFHLLAARFVETGREAGDLAFCEEQITVARQHRTFTGFALLPSHPGVRRLSHFRIRLLNYCASRIT